MSNNISIKNNNSFTPANSIRDQHQNNKDPYKKIANGMEVEFLKYLLKEMRNTVDKNEEDSQEVEFYTQLLDQEYAQALANKNQGVGIQDVILKQLLPKYQNRYPNINPNINLGTNSNVNSNVNSKVNSNTNLYTKLGAITNGERN
ncbi:MAG: rod-binding protein [Oligoflexia bacterium]|nr:rod-binding protein [Oligoflexia bacterium]